MRSINLAFDLDYMYPVQRQERTFELLTSDYIFKCDNYAVAYMFCQILDRLKMCEHSEITEDCFWPYSKIVFFTCRPEDVQRMKCVAKRIPSSIKANVRIYDEEEVEI